MDSPIVVFITGCSSGIGYELLHRFDVEGYMVIGTSLPQSIQQIQNDPISKSPRVRIHELDVADLPQASKLVASVSEEFGSIDILINNAGISYRSVIEEMTPQDEERQMAVNYLGPMHITREALPNMRRKRSGRIINVSSVGGMMAMPTMASYSASKFALEGATESLWYEMKPWNIKVSLVQPGFINSLAFRKVFYSKTHQDDNASSPYHQHYVNMARFVESIMTRTPCTSAHVANKIFKIARSKHPPLRIAGTPDAKLFYYFRRILPRFMYHRILYITLPGIRKWGKQDDTHE